MTPNPLVVERGGEQPFWSYQDLTIFALLSIPCLLASALLSRLLAALVPQVGVSKAWIAMLLFYGLWFGVLYVLLLVGYRRPFWASLGWKVSSGGKSFAVVGGPALDVSVRVV